MQDVLGVEDLDRPHGGDEEERAGGGEHGDAHDRIAPQVHEAVPRPAAGGSGARCARSHAAAAPRPRDHGERHARPAPAPPTGRRPQRRARRSAGPPRSPRSAPPPCGRWQPAARRRRRSGERARTRRAGSSRRPRRARAVSATIATTWPSVSARATATAACTSDPIAITARPSKRSATTPATGAMPATGAIVAMKSAETAIPLPVRSWTTRASVISASMSPADDRNVAPASRCRSRRLMPLFVPQPGARCACCGTRSPGPTRPSRARAARGSPRRSPRARAPRPRRR